MRSDVFSDSSHICLHRLVGWSSTHPTGSGRTLARLVKTMADIWPYRPPCGTSMFSDRYWKQTPTYCSVRCSRTRSSSEYSTRRGIGNSQRCWVEYFAFIHTDVKERPRFPVSLSQLMSAPQEKAAGKQERRRGWPNCSCAIRLFLFE